MYEEQNISDKGDMHASASARLFEYSRALRKEMTPAESLLWEYIRNKKLKEYKFRRQHPVGEYILDFYCHALRLGIEIDGSIHSYGDNKQYDEYRTAYLNEHGITIIRFANVEVLNDIDAVVDKIKGLILKRDSSVLFENLIPNPSPEGEGRSAPKKLY